MGSRLTDPEFRPEYLSSAGQRPGRLFWFFQKVMVISSAGVFRNEAYPFGRTTKTNCTVSSSSSGTALRLKKAYLAGFFEKLANYKTEMRLDAIMPAPAGRLLKKSLYHHEICMQTSLIIRTSRMQAPRKRALIFHTRIVSGMQGKLLGGSGSRWSGIC